MISVQLFQIMSQNLPFISTPKIGQCQARLSYGTSMSALHANGQKSGTCLVKIIKAQISSKGLNVHVRMLKKLKIFFLLSHVSYLINY